MNERPGESAHGGGDPARRDRDAASSPVQPTWVLDRAGLAEVDRLATSEFGIPSFALMENASAGLARHTLTALRAMSRRDVVIVCGPGNNGGDGLAAARHLHNAGCEVCVVLLGHDEAYRGDAATNLAIVRAMGLPVRPLSRWEPCDEDRPAVLIDAVFGTGLARPIEGVFRNAVRRINRLGGAGSRVVAADLPSGLDADTGRVVGGPEFGIEGVCVRADLTVTFAALKPGFGRLDAQRLLGEVVVVSIGCPGELLDRLGERVQPPLGHDSPGPRSEANEPTSLIDPSAGRKAGSGQGGGPGGPESANR